MIPWRLREVSNVLVVDDEFDLSMLLVRLLKVCGHHAACASTGTAALEYLHTHHTSMVILDVMMPEMNGIDVLKTIRADPELRDLPVVMYTALADDDMRRQACEAGAADYLVKGGHSLDLLLNLVRQHASVTH